MTKKKLISALFSLIPFRQIFKLGFNPIIVNYHSILNKDYDDEINKHTYRTEEEFEADLLFFKKYSNIITPEDFRQFVLFQKSLPKNAVLFTVDDGLRISYESLARLFKKHGISAIYFINPAFIDNKDLHYERKISILTQELKKISDFKKSKIISILNRNSIETANYPDCVKNINYKTKNVIDEIAKEIGYDFTEILEKEKPYITSKHITQMIKDGFYFGGHSIDHPNFNELTLKEQIDQAVISTEQISEKYNLNYNVFAFPYNDDFVSTTFFESVKDKIEITFGTAGLIKDSTPKHFQRIDVERSKQSARKELSFLIGKYYIMRLLSKNKINRK